MVIILNTNIDSTNLMAFSFPAALDPCQLMIMDIVFTIKISKKKRGFTNHAKNIEENKNIILR